MSQLEVEAEAIALASCEVVWRLVSDATTYPSWGPWEAAGYESPGDTSPRGVGAVQWLRSADRKFLRRATSVERIVDLEEGRRLVYTVVRGIPVRNYRAEVTLTPTADGTRIHWAATLDSTWPGRVVRRTLRTLYPEIVAGLAAAAESQERS
jgi:uncharacterized protein YndB with AHSA1/START domain